MIPTSCILLTVPVSELPIRQHRLPQAKAAVVDRHAPMVIDCKALRAQHLLYPFKQENVLKRSAGKRHGRRSVRRLSYLETARDDDFRHGPMKPGRDLPDRPPG